MPTIETEAASRSPLVPNTAEVDRALASRIDTFKVELERATPSHAQLRAHPDGRGWLPESMFELARAQAECRLALERFVERERMLFDDASLAPDALFTARVMEALPAQPGLTLRRRRWILLPFFALASAVAGIVISQQVGMGEGGDLILAGQLSELRHAILRLNGTERLGLGSSLGAMIVIAWVTMCALFFGRRGVVRPRP